MDYCELQNFFILIEIRSPIKVITVWVKIKSKSIFLGQNKNGPSYSVFQNVSKSKYYYICCQRALLKISLSFDTTNGFLCNSLCSVLSIVKQPL